MKKTIITIAAALTFLAATAQSFNRSEFSINIGDGASCFQTKPAIGENRWNWSGTAGLGYHFFFNSHWGIGTGANFAIYNGGISIDKYNQQQAATNILTGNKFDFLLTSSDYKEAQQAMTINIPLMLQFQTRGKTAFYAALGGKVAIPVSAKSQSEGKFTTTGYFPDWNMTYDNLPERGFVTNQAFPENKTDIKLKTAFMASAELGVKWRLGKKTSLYTGVYVDYGLNDILEKETAENNNLVVYQPNTPAQFAYNTATNSYAKQMVPVAGGVTLRLAFGCGKHSKKVVKDVYTEEIQQQIVDDSANKEWEEEIWQATKRGIQRPVQNYDLSQTELTAAQKKELDKRIALLQENPDLIIFMYGHTCEIGGDEINTRIGRQRAENAKAYLIENGIEARRILGVASKRDSEPLVPNTNDENRKLNRRVEMRIF